MKQYKFSDLHTPEHFVNAYVSTSSLNYKRDTVEKLTVVFNKLLKDGVSLDIRIFPPDIVEIKFYWKQHKFSFTGTASKNWKNFNLADRIMYSLFHFLSRHYCYACKKFAADKTVI